jgi:transcriptional regulator with XRE-family HTH domain
MRAVREGLGWRLDDLAERCREIGAPMSVATLSRLERGLTRVRWDQIEKIARALGCDAAALLPAEARVDPEAA